MARKLYRPSVEELEALRGPATENGQISEEEWVARNCALNARLLRSDPRRYRSFGPYWWALKNEMLKRGIADFGDFIDQDSLELCSYDTPFHTLLAAWAYSDSALDMGLIYSSEHLVSLLEDGDAEPDAAQYIIEDAEMELLAVQNRI